MLLAPSGQRQGHCCTSHKAQHGFHNKDCSDPNVKYRDCSSWSSWSEVWFSVHLVSFTWAFLQPVEWTVTNLSDTHKILYFLQFSHSQPRGPITTGGWVETTHLERIKMLSSDMVMEKFGVHNNIRKYVYNKFNLIKSKRWLNKKKKEKHVQSQSHDVSLNKLYKSPEWTPNLYFLNAHVLGLREAQHYMKSQQAQCEERWHRGLLPQPILSPIESLMHLHSLSTPPRPWRIQGGDFRKEWFSIFYKSDCVWYIIKFFHSTQCYLYKQNFNSFLLLS